jgi:hypothetical protein
MVFLKKIQRVFIGFMGASMKINFFLSQQMGISNAAPIGYFYQTPEITGECLRFWLSNFHLYLQGENL